MRSIFGANRVALALSIVALLAVLGGGAYAATTSKSISVCVKKHGGALYKAGKCAKGDTKLTWNKTGPAGTRGATGATGPAGAIGASGTNGTNGTNGTGETYDSLTTLSDGNGSGTGPTIGSVTFAENCNFSSGEITFTVNANPAAGTSWAAQGWYTLGSGSTGLTGSTPALLNTSSSTSDGTLLAVTGATSPPYPAYPVLGDILLTSAGNLYDVELHLDIDSNLGKCGGGVSVTPVGS